MPFENVTIQVTKDSSAPATMWRQDATAGSVMGFSLSDTRGVHTYAWRLKGRPEGSGAGGGGPEPLSLGNAQTANITVDRRGTYVVECTVNAGAPNAETLRAGVAYLETLTSPDGLPLRLLGPGESDEDISDPLVRQGWIKMLNRWLKTISSNGANQIYHVRQVATAYDGTGTTTSGANSWWSCASVPAFANTADADILVHATVSGTCATKNVKVYARVVRDGAVVATGEVTGSASYDGGPVDLTILSSFPEFAAGTHAYGLQIASSTTDVFSETYGSDHSQMARLVVTELGLDDAGSVGPEGPPGPSGTGGTGSADVADWDVTKVRYIFLDGDGGNDAHLGYIDDAPGTDFTSRMSEVAGVAVKTTHRINEIRKCIGAGRMCVVLLKPRTGGATYDHTSPGDGLGMDDRHLLSGYSLLHTRGSDLTNSLTDRKQLGYHTPAGVTGPGSTGEWTVGTVTFGPEGITIQLVGSTLPAAWELARFRLRALLGGTSTVYGAILWGDLHGGSDALLARGGPIGGINTGDKVWLEYPGAKLDQYIEASSVVANVTAQPIASVGLAIVSAARLGCSDDPVDTHYSHIVVEAGGQILGTPQEQGSISSDGSYTDETGTTGIENGPGIVAPTCNIAAHSVSLSNCSIADQASGDAMVASSITAEAISIGSSALQTCTIYDGSLGVNVGYLAHGNITFYTSAHAEISNMRGVPSWNPVVVLGNANSDVSRNFQNMHNLFASAGGAEPSSPGIILKNGQYTVTFDFENDVANSTTIQPGNGVLIQYTDDGAKSTPLTYASLKTTGFEVIGGQKVVCKSTGVDNGFVGSLLPCPRGTVRPVANTWPSPGVGNEKPGVVLSWYNGLDVLGVASASSDGFPNFLYGISLTNWDPAGSTDTPAYAVVGDSGPMMVQRDSRYSATPTAGMMAYLTDGNGSFGGGFNSYPSLQGPGGWELGRVSVPRGSGPCQIVWQPRLRSTIQQTTGDTHSTDATSYVVIANSVYLGLGYYAIDAQFDFTAAAAGGIDVKIVGGSGFADDSTGRHLWVEIIEQLPTPGLALTQELAFGSGSEFFVTGPTRGMVRITGILLVTTPGTIAFEFHKAVASGADTIVYAGSYYRATPA